MIGNKLVHQKNVLSFKGYFSFNIFILDEPEQKPEQGNDEGKIVSGLV